MGHRWELQHGPIEYNAGMNMGELALKASNRHRTAQDMVERNICDGFLEIATHMHEQDPEIADERRNGKNR
jgi:hypothetical protein